MLKTIIIFIMSAKISASSLVGSCNQCFAGNKIACLNETHFSTCFQGSPTATITKCPNNKFCTKDVLICHSFIEGYTPVCYNDSCGECGITNGVFTCLNETTYGYCFGAKTPLQETYRSCPSRYVCNYNSRNVCVSEDVSEPSCGIKTTTTTEISTMTTDNTIATVTRDLTTTDQAIATTEMAGGTTTEITMTSSTQNEPRNANTICEEIRKTGYFKSDDPTCRQYVYCVPLSGQYLGWFFYCNLYFNAVTQKCQEERPLNCVAY